MKIEYRIQKDYIEIVRCYGVDSCVTLPAQIDGYLVKKVAAYTFSARKSQEDADVLTYESEEGLLLEENNKLLAGVDVEKVIFPETVEEIGNYIFYGCKELRYLEFSNTLMSIGSGAFTGCGKLSGLKVHMKRGEKSCVKEILGDLWQRIDVTFIYEEAGKEARLVFPEHYEEAVENTPARILFTQHHGTGNNYRQCFYNKEMDYRKYDELFVLAKAQDKQEVLVDMVFNRLEYPYDLTDKNKDEYKDYMLEHFAKWSEILVEQDAIERLQFLSKQNLWSREMLDTAIMEASEKKRGETLSFLMNEKQSLYPERKKKTFEL
ncbi:leucine-rich repeat domain-containing protein [Firmicutes bacterium AM43-11BH]|nr:leucine-rich repeat domain-containing protein [Firmicutes bacterium AM43-11BH]